MRTTALTEKERNLHILQTVVNEYWYFLETSECVLSFKLVLGHVLPTFDSNSTRGTGFRSREIWIDMQQKTQTGNFSPGGLLDSFLLCFNPPGHLFLY